MTSSGDPTSNAADALIGTVIADRYRVDELLGEGGMGKVYSAEHLAMKKRVAIKALRRELSVLPDVVERFEREAMATASVEHPNIAGATDFGRLPDGSLFFVLELVKGASLRDEIKAGPFPVERALHIARQIAGALAAAHGLGIVHRDLKPENVMLVTRGADRDIVKVLDFGIAKIRLALNERAGAAPLTKAGEVFGTPEYMAPEQALGQSVDARADLYALGVILYEMLSGERPFSSKSEVGVLAQKLAQPVSSFAERVPSLKIPARVERVVTTLLAKEAALRFQTAEQVARALDELLRPAPEPETSVAEPAPKTAFLGTSAQVYSATPPAAPSPAPAAAPIEPAAPVISPLNAAPEPALPVAAPSVPRGPSVWARTAGVVRRTFRDACAYIDANRSRLPGRLEKALRRIPASALLAIGAVLIGTLLVASVALIRARPHAESKAAASSSAAVEQPKEDPVLRELTDAKQQGHAALLKLSEQHPKSAPVWVELGLSHAAKSDFESALTAFGKALDLDPKVNEQPPIADALATAVRKKNTQDSAFNLLAGQMGAAGAGVLYDLALDQKVPASLRSRAEQWVRSPSFEKVASPELKVAAGLRWAKSCSDRYDLLSQAKEVGGKRALAYLKIMRNRSGCGRRNRDDCFPCLRKDESLGAAIAAIEKRLAEKP